jgi:excisionase family DNA binding protein
MVELVTPAEAARELRVSLGTIYGWLHAGRVLPGIRLGGQWRISRAALDAVAAGEVAPVPVPNDDQSYLFVNAIDTTVRTPVLPDAEPRPPHPDPGWDVEQAR